MSDVASTAMDSDVEPGGGSLPAAERLFAAEEFFLPITSTAALGTDIVVKGRPEDVGPNTPRGLLYVAAYANHVHVLLRPAKRKRQQEKGRDLYYYLQRLQRDPGRDTGFVQHGRLGDRRRKAYFEFLYWLRRMTFKSRMDARAMVSQTEFAREQQFVVNSWELLACIASEIYEPLVAGNCSNRLARQVVAHLKHKLPDAGATSDPVAKTPLPFRCSALFCTWFLDLGPELVQVLAGIAAGQGRRELAVLFRSSKAHMDAFTEFVSFCDGLVAMLGARVHAVAMEIGTCTSKNTPAQVHVHFFASSGNADGGFVNAEVQLMVVDPVKLLFRGKGPQHMSSSKVHKGYRAGSTVQKAMYYLLCDKIGSIFQQGSATPFQDSCVVVLGAVLVARGFGLPSLAVVLGGLRSSSFDVCVCPSCLGSCLFFYSYVAAACLSVFFCAVPFFAFWGLPVSFLAASLSGFLVCSVFLRC